MLHLFIEKGWKQPFKKDLHKMKIVFGTNNKHKIYEVNEISKNSGVEFILPPSGYAPDETGKDFEENAIIKSKAGAILSKMPCLSDDSGLCVEALNGAPGIYSARYAESQDDRINRLITELNGIKNRRAKFVCCMCLTDETGKVIRITKGECEGNIIFEQRGLNGFGYDPIFLPLGSELTLAQMSDAEKNKISHRGNALRAMLKFII